MHAQQGVVGVDEGLQNPICCFCVIGGEKGGTQVRMVVNEVWWIKGENGHIDGHNYIQLSTILLSDASRLRAVGESHHSIMHPPTDDLRPLVGVVVPHDGRQGLREQGADERVLLAEEGGQDVRPDGGLCGVFMCDNGE